MKTMKKILAIVLALCLGLAVVACNKVDPAVALANAQESGITRIKDVLEAKRNSYTEEDFADCDVIYRAGYKAIKAATTTAEVTAAVDSVLKQYEEALKGSVAMANGAYTYVASSYADRTKILAALEEYAVKYGLTGLTLYQSAGYGLYNSGIQLGTQTYIVGYGFGAISEGGITTGLNYEGMNPAYAMYYHSFESEDPGTINYGDDKGSVVGDLQPYISGSYFGTKMNETKDGYEWYCDLALEKPQPDLVAGSDNEALYNASGLSTSWKFQVRTGSALKYSTLTQVEALKKYDGQEVQPEDYLTPYKMLWTQANGWARATDNHGSSGEIVGEAAYYEASADGFNAAAWENVGVKVTVENGVATLHIEFVTPCNSFYAMYYTSSSIYAPLPESFVEAIGGADVFGNFDSEAGYTPVDTTLSTGVFTLESWVNDSEIVFKKNERNDREEGRYNVAGVHLAILKGISTDKELAFKEFMAGKLSACSVPSTQLENYMGKSEGVSELNANVSYYVKQTNGGSTYKLNCNTLDQATWIAMFGENGTITQTDKADYWECEPIMNDHNFYLGISYALDRKGLAEKLGLAFSVNYFGDTYLSDPEAGITYNATEEHKAAIKSLIADADQDGYDLEIARGYFKKAAEAALANGTYKAGDVIEIEIAWMYASDEEEYHNFIKKCWEDAFNDPSVCGGQLTLNVVFWAGASWSDVYYNKMMPGQYDIGFGSVTGNSLNPLNFMEVLRSDNSSGFTLNWGTDTSVVSEDLIWDGVAWSYDALWKAADQGGYFERSVEAPVIRDITTDSVTVNADGSQTLVFSLDAASSDVINVKLDKVMIYAYDATATYNEDACDASYDKETGKITVNVSADLCAKYAADNLYDGGMDAYCGAYHGIDVYLITVINMIPAPSACNTVQPADGSPLPFISFGE